MKLDNRNGFSRREFLKKAGLLGLSISGAGAALEVVFGDDVLAASTAESSARIRLAMVVDMSKCARKEDCTDCMTACHRAHNVPSISSKRHEIKWIWKEPFVNAFPEQRDGRLRGDLVSTDFIVLCNHCDNPPCVRVCPTKATWKRPDGIVMMDMHRCIGCRYCMAACPYGSRSFNWMDPRRALDEKTINQEYPTRTKGVVEKCDFCAERIDHGRLPVCVEACKEKALVFGNLSDAKSEVSLQLAGRFAIRRKPELGTRPEVYYIV
jgi:molybdopterin-containing oxidoreductase family iron-sulfur binding subunit